MKASELKDRPASEHTLLVRQRILADCERLDWRSPVLETGIPGLTLYRMTDPSAPFSSIYEPSVSLIIRGSKRVVVGAAVLDYDESNFLLTAIDLPTTVQILEASDAEPYYAALLRLDLECLRRIIVQHDVRASAPQRGEMAIAVGTATTGLFDALARLIGLMDTPRDIPFLAMHIHEEILYRLLSGEQGAYLRRIALSGTQTNRVAAAIAWLKENYMAPLRVEQLAEIARMGVSTLHHHFRAMTAMSPLQYQKHLRLHHARELMLSEAADAATAAFRVGYESPTQFSREYRRMFGAPPMRHIKAIQQFNVQPGTAR
ncbi:AraC family transcriptional regulator [Oxalobacteraceae bacterium OTU3CINTB1]|nr:AraC family transcriptional regulator [Oxalobacteraceae bacterium OTU3CINTB1]